MVGEGRRGAAPRGRPDDEPQHRAVRRAPADDRLRRPRRNAGGDDARLRRRGLPRGGADHRRGARGRVADLEALRGRTRCPVSSGGRSTRLPRLHHLSSSPRAMTRTEGTNVVHPWRSVTEVHAPTRPAQARPAPRRHDDDADVPAARQRADAAPHVRGDEGPRGRGGRDRDAARAHDRTTDLGQEGRRVPDPPRRDRDARRRALAGPGRPGRLHRPLPQRGDARAGRVLRQASRATSPIGT